MKFYYLFLLLMTGFVSCVQKRYIHSAAPVLNPMIKEKGEGFVSAYYHTNGKSEASVNSDMFSENTSGGFNMQAGYALAKHFAIAGAYNYGVQKQNFGTEYSAPFDRSFVHYRRNEITLAGDYFFTNKAGSVGMNILAGFTAGRLRLNDKGVLDNASYSRFFNANSLAWFFQPCLNFYLSDHSGIGLSTKFGYVGYNNLDHNYTQYEIDRLRLSEVNSIFLAEFGIKTSIGFQNIPVTLDGQFNYIYNNSGKVYLRKTNLSFGLSYRFVASKKKK